MRKTALSNRELQRAAGLLRISMLDSVQALPAYERGFSGDFLEKMDVLLAQARRGERARTLVYRAASIFLALLIGAGIYLAADTEVRAAVLAWAREVYEHSVLYRFYGQTEETLPLYRPSWLPEGFALADEVIDSASRSLYYINETGDLVDFTYSYMHDGAHIELLNAAGVPDVEKYTIHGMDADFYPTDDSSNTNNLIWFDETQNIVFCINSNLDKFNILRISESIYLDNSTKK